MPAGSCVPSSFAYASRLRPRGVERPVSHALTVAFVTPMASATCSSLRARASRNLRRSFGVGRVAEGAESAVLRLIGVDLPQSCSGRKST